MIKFDVEPDLVRTVIKFVHATVHRSSSLSCMNENIAIDSGGYLCANNLHALNAT